MSTVFCADSDVLQRPPAQPGAPAPGGCPPPTLSFTCPFHTCVQGLLQQEQTFPCDGNGHLSALLLSVL